MADWKSDYNRLVLRARNAVMHTNGISYQSYLEIYRSIAQAVIDFNRDLGAGMITAQRLPQIQENLARMVAGLRDTLPAVLDKRLTESARRALQGHIEGLERAMSLTGVQIPQTNPIFSRANKLIVNALEYYPVRAGMSPDFRFRTLINIGISDLQRDLDTLIGSAINRGISADRLTSEMAMAMSKNDLNFRKVLSELGPRGGLIRNGMRTVSLTDDQIGRAKNFLYQMRRIAVSEINNAYYEADRLSSEVSPVVQYVEWQVSSRHFGLPSTPDECTFNYETDQYGLGIGVFYPETAPSLLHPFCGCFTRKVLREPEQWLTPFEEPKAPRTFSEKGYRRYFKGKSPSHRKKAIQTVNQKNRLAWEFYNNR